MSEEMSCKTIKSASQVRYSSWCMRNPFEFSATARYKVYNYDRFICRYYWNQTPTRTVPHPTKSILLCLIYMQISSQLFCPVSRPVVWRIWYLFVPKVVFSLSLKVWAGIFWLVCSPLHCSNGLVHLAICLSKFLSPSMGYHTLVLVKNQFYLLLF